MFYILFINTVGKASELCRTYWCKLQRENERHTLNLYGSVDCLYGIP